MTEQKDALQENIPENLKGLTSAQVDETEKAASVAQSRIADQNSTVLVADTTKSSPDPRFVDPNGNALGTEVSVSEAKNVTPDGVVSEQIDIEQINRGQAGDAPHGTDRDQDVPPNTAEPLGVHGER